MTARNSTRARRNCFEAHRYTHPVTGRTVMDCASCGCVIEPGAGGTWEADHVLLHVYGGNDDGTNMQPLCVPCHREKSGKDKSFIAKGKRQSDSIYGVKRSKKPMPGSRNHPSKLRKRMDGTVERWP